MGKKADQLRMENEQLKARIIELEEKLKVYKAMENYVKTVVDH